MSYIRLNIVTEGQTEQRFVYEILALHLGSLQVGATARAVETSPGFKGGIPSYAKAKNDIMRWMREDQNNDVRFSTMFDLYGLPTDFPQYAEASKLIDPYERVDMLEQALADDIDDSRFIPYIQLHEFESLIFTDPARLLAEYLDYEKAIQTLISIGEENEPERINDDPNSAPSKRILAQVPIYRKAIGGISVVKEIGLSTLRERCPHFDKWLSQLENLAKPF